MNLRRAKINITSTENPLIYYSSQASTGAKLTIHGGDFNLPDDFAGFVDEGVEGVSIVINGGSFNKNIADYVPAENFRVVDGLIYSADGSCLLWCKSDVVNANVLEGTKKIAQNAFRDCTLLENITIPSSVTSIGADAFYGCTSLTIYCMAESQPSGWSSSWNSSSCPVYWYSEEEPSTSGNYWHYGTNNEIVAW